MENKGNKSGNIYQKLKGAGAWQSKDSAGPMIKGVGIKSPLNMKKSPAKLMPSKDAMATIKNNQQKKKNAEARKSGKAVSYKDAYADADKKKYKTYDAFEKAAKKYNKDKYDSENPTSDAKKAGKTKAQLAKEVADKKKVTTTNTGTGDETTTTNTEVTTNTGGGSENVVKKTRKEVRLENKGKRKAKRKANQQKRADRIKKEGGTKVGNFLRKKVKQVKDVVKKKDDSPVEMKKSAMKMKKSPAKKALVGKQGNLPEHLKAKIKAAPGKMKKSAMKLKGKPSVGKKVKTGGSVSEKRAEKIVEKGKGRMIYKVGGIGKDNQAGGKNNKGDLMKYKKNSIKIKKIKR